MTGDATRRSARSGVVGLAGAALSGLCGFGLTVVITRGYGTTGAGGFFTLIGVVTVALAVCGLGADTGLIWALPRRSRGRGGDAGRVLTAALVPPLVLAVALAVVGLAAAGPLADRLLASAGPVGTSLLRCAFGALPVAVAMNLLLAAVRAVRPIAHYAAVQFVLLPVSRPLLVGAAALTGAGLLGGVLGWLVPVAAAALVCAALVVGPLGLRAPGALRSTRADWRSFWSFAGPRALSAAIDAASMWVGVLLTAVLAGQTEAGVFGAVGRYVLAGQLAMQGLRVATAPQLSALLGAGRRADAAAVYRQTTGAIVLLSWPVYLLLACFAPGFLRLFGSGFAAGAGALTVLSAAMLVNVGLGTVQTLLLMSGASRAHLLATVAGLATTLGVGVLATPRYGAFGAACAWAGGIVVENVLAAVAARRVVGHRLLTGRLLRTAALTAAALVVVCLVAVPVAGRGVPGLAVALGLLVVLCAAAAGTRRVRRAVADTIAAVRAGRATPAPAGRHREEGTLHVDAS